jgi:hypothetical protein
MVRLLSLVVEALLPKPGAQARRRAAVRYRKAKKNRLKDPPTEKQPNRE